MFFKNNIYTFFVSITRKNSLASIKTQEVSSFDQEEIMFLKPFNLSQLKRDNKYELELYLNYFFFNI